MPAPAVDLDDDASIAQLLAADARASSSRYATQGLSALLPKRATGSAPKPNTRFLKALVRDADSHNAALRRKEDRDRVERLRNGGQGVPDRVTKHSENHRHRKDDKYGGERKRRRLDDGRDTIEDNERQSRHAKSRRHKRRDDDDHVRSRSKSRSRSRSRSEDERRRHKRRREADGQRSRGDRGSGSDDEPHRSHRKHKRRHSRPRSAQRDPTRDQRSKSPSARERPSRRRDSSSDPLEDIVGPLPAKESDVRPAVRVRGRGAHKLATTSNIDAHFSSNYDPSLDVRPDDEQPDEKQDWDMALEALRDRQAWKKNHADRMREAGFGDDEIAKWEEGGRDKDARDVRWRSRGQTREWDVGKDQQVSDEEDQEGRLTP